MTTPDDRWIAGQLAAMDAAAVGTEIPDRVLAACDDLDLWLGGYRWEWLPGSRPGFAVRVARDERAAVVAVITWTDRGDARGPFWGVQGSTEEIDIALRIGLGDRSGDVHLGERTIDDTPGD